MTTPTLEERIREIVDYCAESYYPEHEYGDSHKEQNQEYLSEAVTSVMEAIEAAGYSQITPAERTMLMKLRDGQQFMTSDEWLARFEREQAKPEYNGMYYEEAVLLMARRASGVQE